MACTFRAPHVAGSSLCGQFELSPSSQIRASLNVGSLCMIFLAINTGPYGHFGASYRVSCGLRFPWSKAEEAGDKSQALPGARASEAQWAMRGDTLNQRLSTWSPTAASTLKGRVDLWKLVVACVLPLSLY